MDVEIIEHTNKIGCFLLEFFCVGGKSSVTYTIRYTNYFSPFPSEIWQTGNIRYYVSFRLFSCQRFLEITSGSSFNHHLITSRSTVGQF